MGPYKVSQGFKQEWTSNSVDSQWSVVYGGSSYTVVGKFYNGSTVSNVTGAQAWTPGTFICKHGITTGFTCGYVDANLYTDSYGSFPRVNVNSTYTQQSKEGDSGGPVFSGTLAIGQVHGRDASYNMYFTPLTAWYDENLPIGVLCICGP